MAGVFSQLSGTCQRHDHIWVSGVIEDVVVVEVTSSRVPNLTLVDLPGLCVTARPGEPENIKECTQSLVEKYLQHEHTLVLLVLPGMAPIHNYQPMELVRKHRRLNNTIGVLTKADLAESSRFIDRFHELKEKLDGRSADYVPLDNGYVAVRNRDTLGTNINTLEQASVEEVEWFDKHLPGYVDNKQASSLVLIEKLVEMMCTYVKNTWAPQAKSTINARLNKLKLELDGLGPVRTGDELPLILKEVSQFFSGSCPGGVDFEATFGAAAKRTMQGVSTVQQDQYQSYPYRAAVVKSLYQADALKVLQDATFVSATVRGLLDQVKIRPEAKLARFECLFDTLEAVLSGQFRIRAQSAKDQFLRKLATVFALFDSNPDLQPTPAGYGAPHVRGWVGDLHARVVALLTTIIYEEVFLPLEANLRALPDELIDAMVTRLEATSNGRGQGKARLVAEGAQVADKRKQWSAESKNLHSALASIASLQE
jgi:GTP-binding protein EngB required for normal cell division